MIAPSLGFLRRVRDGWEWDLDYWDNDDEACRRRIRIFLSQVNAEIAKLIKPGPAQAQR